MQVILGLTVMDGVKGHFLVCPDAEGDENGWGAGASPGKMWLPGF